MRNKKILGFLMIIAVFSIVFSMNVINAKTFQGAILEEDPDIKISTHPEIEPSNTLLKGDLNGDGVINSVDAAMVLDLYNNSEAEYIEAADMDGNGIVNSVDASLILDLYTNN